MPELPEVETTRRGLLPHLKGQRIAGVIVRRGDLRLPIPNDFAGRVTGKTIADIRRRAKYLLFDLDSEQVMMVHLGMSGSLRTVDAQSYQPRTHDHVIFDLENGVRVAFHDPRRFGLIDLFARREEIHHPLLMHLGPEPLSATFNARYLVSALARRSGPIKPVLMNQEVVVGVGNIYASESLFLAGIDPRAPARRTAPQAEKLVKAIKATLKSALASGGSSLRDYVGADGGEGYFQHRFKVYERDGEKCFTCATAIAATTQSGRATYYCPRCQGTAQRRQKA